MMVIMTTAQPTPSLSSPSPVTASAAALTPADYLIKILNARVYDVAVESAFE